MAYGCSDHATMAKDHNRLVAVLGVNPVERADDPFGQLQIGLRTRNLSPLLGSPNRHDSRMLLLHHDSKLPSLSNSEEDLSKIVFDPNLEFVSHRQRCRTLLGAGEA